MNVMNQFGRICVWYAMICHWCHICVGVRWDFSPPRPLAIRRRTKKGMCRQSLDNHPKVEKLVIGKNLPKSTNIYQDHQNSLPPPCASWLHAVYCLVASGCGLALECDPENHSFPKWAVLNGSKSRLKLRNQVVGQHVANSDHVVLSVITLKKRQEWQECDLWNTCSVSHLIIHHLIWSHLISFDLIWSRLISFDLIWSHPFTPFQSISIHFNPFQSISIHLNNHGSTPFSRWLTNPHQSTPSDSPSTQLVSGQSSFCLAKVLRMPSLLCCSSCSSCWILRGMPVEGLEKLKRGVQ